MKDYHAKLLCLLFISFLFGGIQAHLFAQNQVFIATELRTGAIVPNFPNFPKTGISKGFNLSVGNSKFGDEHWVNYYNKPTYGLSFSYTNSSNVKEFGHEFGGLVFLELSPNRQTEQKWFFRLGMGATYFTNYYHAIINERNKVIGSNWNWRFNTFLYRKIYQDQHLLLRVGAGFVHSSNGHTQIPNYGMNAGMLGISARFYQNNPYANTENFKRSTTYEKKERTKFIQTRFGLGMHEYGSTIKPVGGDKKAVYTAAFAYGWQFNQQLKLRTGIAYRFYQQFYEEIQNNDSISFSAPKWEASNFYWFLGIEYLIGNFAIDVEGGINLYKPYSEQFYQQFKEKMAIKEWLKRTFPMRLALNYYLFKPSRMYTYNAYIGASINANFGQADFSQVNVGISKKLGK